MNLKTFLKNPLKTTIFHLHYRHYLNWINDKTFLKLLYKLETGKRLNLKNPQTFNEKLQWLKLYNRVPEYTTMVDKYEVKNYLANKIGDEYVIPCIGIYDSFDQINLDELPNQFVIKCTHNSAVLIFCKDKSNFNLENYKEKIEKTLKSNYFYRGREWPYKNVKPRILIEKYMKDNNFDVLPVYKVFNFDGEPKLIQVILNDKTKNETVDYYSPEWEKLDLRQNFPNSSIVLPKPEKLNEILNLAKELSKGFPHIRTDFYIINNRIYFSEFTFFSDCGFATFDPESWDLTLGKLIKLPKKVK